MSISESLQHRIIQFTAEKAKWQRIFQNKEKMPFIILFFIEKPYFILYNLSGFFTKPEIYKEDF